MIAAARRRSQYGNSEADALVPIHTVLKAHRRNAAAICYVYAVDRRMGWKMRGAAARSAGHSVVSFLFQ
jgi:hypothetical protein